MSQNGATNGPIAGTQVTLEEGNFRRCRAAYEWSWSLISQICFVGLDVREGRRGRIGVVASQGNIPNQPESARKLIGSWERLRN